ncbi:MAG: hypothetical protein ACU0GG_12040 [Paracoccaceae bacterium]
MQNVIAFPKKAVAAPAARRTGGAQTLFLHIRQTTLIVHLAAAQTPPAKDSRLGSKA